MSCDQHFERCLQNKFDMAFGSKNKKRSHKNVSAAPHRLYGTEVWLEAGGKGVVFLEGVTGIQFCDGKVIFQTVLGETIPLEGELERVTIREGGLICQAK
ncbi:MAG: CooT family nickel-binding protein [Candidatus Manganitrophus sp. SA1]|nr:CooT family nickel-binding protein [Candidatus Manganitrophus morganii]